jgi:hypothetical protein
MGRLFYDRMAEYGTCMAFFSHMQCKLSDSDYINIPLGFFTSSSSYMHELASILDHDAVRQHPQCLCT